MASVTNLPRARSRGIPRLDVLARGLPACGEGVPLLAFRVPGFERVAWRSGKIVARQFERKISAAFESAAQDVLRKTDSLGHDAGSDVFAAVMHDSPRSGRNVRPAACRAALARIAARVVSATGEPLDTGWTIVPPADGARLQMHLDAALSRGAIERQRYEFFAAVGHELRTPITSIRAYLDTLIEADPARCPHFLRQARSETLRLARLVDGMFEFSMLDMTAAPGDCGCDLDQAMLQARDAVRALARARSANIALGSPSKATVAMDPDECVRVFVNLFENAVKYGRARGRIRVQCATTAAAVEVCVDDDGPGVDVAERENVFAFGFRSASLPKRGGAGLGLAIVRRTLERAGGAIEATDSPLGGARFAVTMPLRAESEVRTA